MHATGHELVSSILVLCNLILSYIYQHYVPGGFCFILLSTYQAGSFPNLGVHERKGR